MLLVNSELTKVLMWGSVVNQPFPSLGEGAGLDWALFPSSLFSFPPFPSLPLPFLLPSTLSSSFEQTLPCYLPFSYSKVWFFLLYHFVVEQDSEYMMGKHIMVMAQFPLIYRNERMKSWRVSLQSTFHPTKEFSVCLFLKQCLHWESLTGLFLNLFILI